MKSCGRAAFFKLGAAPTYIKRGQKVSRITAAALPPGPGFGSVSSDVTRLTLCAGDMVVMSSDGLAQKGEDGVLVEKFSKFEGNSPRLLAAEHMSGVSGDDDVTVFAIRIEENK